MKQQTYKTVVLLILGIIYMGLVSATFIFEIDLAINKTIQYILHITVILSAFSYLLFIDGIYGIETDKENGRLALIFTLLFTIPIVLGRGIGIYYLTYNVSNELSPILNFYSSVSVTRSMELLSWTIFYPFSMIYLALLFFNKAGYKWLAWICLSSSICCLIAFISFFSTNSIYLYIGLLGWGLLFELVVIVYLYKQVKQKKQ